MSHVSYICISTVRAYPIFRLYFFIHFSLNLCLNLSRNPLAQLEEEKREHDNKMKKMETEMEQVFEMKVREKRQKLKDSETDVSEARHRGHFFNLRFISRD